MSLAHIDSARSVQSYRPELTLAPAPAPAAPRIRAVPDGTQARGFVLYVGIDEAKAAAAGTSLHRIVEAIKELTGEIAPSAQTYAAVALAPAGAGGEVALGLCRGGSGGFDRGHRRGHGAEVAGGSGGGGGSFEESGVRHDDDP
jgi:hypothetical protein